MPLARLLQDLSYMRSPDSRGETLHVLLVHVSVSFAKYDTLTALTIFGHKRGAHEFVEGDRSFWDSFWGYA